MQMHKIFVIAILILALSTVTLVGCGEDGTTTIRIGSTNFSEPWILGEVVKVVIEEHTDVGVEHIINFQGNNLLHQSLMSGDLDMYISWTGTQFTGILEMEVTEEWKDRERVFQYVKDEFEERYNQTWFPPFGFNNTYALAVRQEFAEEHNLETSSDLVDLSPELTIAFDQTFGERIGDGYRDMTEHYGFNFEQGVAMDYGVLYRALAHGDVEVGVAYTTDGRVPALDLAILEDDREFFPPYDGALIARNELLEEHPEIVEVLDVLWGVFDVETMAELNARADVDEEEYQDIAREFARSQGWIE